VRWGRTVSKWALLRIMKHELYFVIELCPDHRTPLMLVSHTAVSSFYVC
jgi:hypothetical protein